MILIAKQFKQFIYPACPIRPSRSDQGSQTGAHLTMTL
jgi:hypothetical protein